MAKEPPFFGGVEVAGKRVVAAESPREDRVNAALEKILEHMAQGAKWTVAVRLAGISQPTALAHLKRERSFRDRVLALIPCRAQKPSEFVRWLLHCEKLRGAVGFDGDLRIPDLFAIRQVARSTQWAKDGGTGPLDVLVCGRAANPGAYLERLPKGSVIMGVGVGPVLVGWQTRNVNLQMGRCYRMVNQ